MSRYAAADSFMAVFGMKRMSIADMLAERSKLLAQIAQLDEALVSQGVRPDELLTHTPSAKRDGKAKKR